MESPEHEHEHDHAGERHGPQRSHTLEPASILQPIRELMRTNVGAVSPRDRVGDAIQQMVRGHYGCVLVIEDCKLRGIFSERDILCKVIYPGLNQKEVTVGEVMTTDPETLSPDDALAYALNIMTVGGFRHVPIVNPDGSLAGILSIRDIQRFLVSHFREEILTLPPRPLIRGPAQRYGG